MAKVDFDNEAEAKKVVADLRTYRSGWANDIREGWKYGIPGARELTFELYEISGVIVLALENRLAGDDVDKMPMFLTKKKLEALVASDVFKKYDELGQANVYKVVTSGTKHHIRVMFECLEFLTA